MARMLKRLPIKQTVQSAYADMASQLNKGGVPCAVRLTDPDGPKVKVGRSSWGNHVIYVSHPEYDDSGEGNWVIGIGDAGYELTFFNYSGGLTTEQVVGIITQFFRAMDVAQH